MRVELTTSRATIWRSNQLSYTHHIHKYEMACLQGFEPRTYCLEGSCSIQLSYRHKLERVMGIEPTQSAWKAEILAIELHPQITVIY